MQPSGSSHACMRVRRARHLMPDGIERASACVYSFTYVYVYVLRTRRDHYCIASSTQQTSASSIYSEYSIDSSMQQVRRASNAFAAWAAASAVIG